MAPSVPVNFISQVTSCVGLWEEEPQTALPHVLYIGVSYSHWCANAMLKSTQSINQDHMMVLDILNTIVPHLRHIRYCSTEASILSNMLFDRIYAHLYGTLVYDTLNLCT